jgi:hypothetical protein
MIQTGGQVFEIAKFKSPKNETQQQQNNPL